MKKYMIVEHTKYGKLYFSEVVTPLFTAKKELAEKYKSKTAAKKRLAYARIFSTGSQVKIEEI